MYIINPSKYNSFNLEENTTHVLVLDHMGGFTSDNSCRVLQKLQSYDKPLTVSTEYLFDQSIKTHFNNLNLIFSKESWTSFNHIDAVLAFTNKRKVKYKNFLCSFNGSEHEGRKLLISILNAHGLFDQKYCSKNFKFDLDNLDGLIAEYSSNERLQRKFILGEADNNFFRSINSFTYSRNKHLTNLQLLEEKITESFIHIVSETLATSYYPFHTEKFLYSVVNRGLFLAYAQPKWHSSLELNFGFKLYSKIFDYSFDQIENPITRLIALISSLLKFKSLSFDDLYDIYLMELDTINYNYDRFYSGDYLKHI